jgi:hypothetical protein
MPSNIRYLKYLFLGLLLVGVTGTVGYDLLYGRPKRECEAAKNWWSWKDRHCYTPVYLPTLTHRKPGEPSNIDWHDKKAAAGAAASGTSVSK